MPEKNKTRQLRSPRRPSTGCTITAMDIPLTFHASPRDPCPLSPSLPFRAGGLVPRHLLLAVPSCSRMPCAVNATHEFTVAGTARTTKWSPTPSPRKGGRCGLWAGLGSVGRSVGRLTPHMLWLCIPYTYRPTCTLVFFSERYCIVVRFLGHSNWNQCIWEYRVGTPFAVVAQARARARVRVSTADG